jgi:regulator of protease activity HflC (stomatin/prohibitin superfamily)
MNLCLSQLREEVGKLMPDKSFSSRERINLELLKDLNAGLSKLGCQGRIARSRTVSRDCTINMAAECKKRAAILTSEGHCTT